MSIINVVITLTVNDVDANVDVDEDVENDVIEFPATQASHETSVTSATCPTRSLASCRSSGSDCRSENGKNTKMRWVRIPEK